MATYATAALSGGSPSPVEDATTMRMGVSVAPTRGHESWLNETAAPFGGGE
jgi:hypothetical protein